MTLSLSFHNPQGNDGVLVGSLPRVDATNLVGTVDVNASTVLFYDAQSASFVVSDITAAASDLGVTITPFNSTVPGGDAIYIDTSVCAGAIGVRMEVKIAGAGLTPSTAPIVVDFWNGTAMQLATNVVGTAALFGNTGLIQITFDALPVINNWPVGSFLGRFLRIRVPTLTSVTTPPQIERMYLTCPETSRLYNNITNITNQGNTPNFGALFLFGTYAPRIGDLSWFFIHEKKFCKVFMELFRHNTTDAIPEWVYWNGTAASTFPAGTFTDPTNFMGTINTASHNAYDLDSTYAGTTWGSSGVASTSVLPADGYVEWAVDTTTLEHFIGFSATNTDNHFNTIQRAIHVGHGGTAFISFWMSGVQQGTQTYPIVLGDVLRIERVAGVYSAYQNGQLRHTFAGTQTGNVVVDTAFIRSARADKVRMVSGPANTSIYTNITTTWGTATLLNVVTVPNGFTLDVQTSHVITFVPPADWQPITLTDTSNVSHTGFAVGWRYTTSATLPVRTLLSTFRLLPLANAVATGITMRTATAVNGLSLYFEDASAPTIASDWLLTNATSGEMLRVQMPANQKLVNISGSLNYSANDVATVIGLTNITGQEPDHMQLIAHS